MATNKYKIIILPTFHKEALKIYDYITDDLYAETAAKRLMVKIEEAILKLQTSPKIHSEIEKIDELKRIYRRIVINNYVILYTIDEENGVIFVSHIYYGRSNYFEK